MRRVSRCLVVPFVLACAACFILQPDVEYWVVGTVRDASDGSPIHGATVEVYRALIYERLGFASTDVDGRYSLRYSLPCGFGMRFEYSAQGYWPRFL